MIKIRKYGFTILELMVVMLLIGMLTTMVMPRLFRRSPATNWKNIVEELNNIVFFAQQEAIVNQKNYRLVFQKKIKEEHCVFIEEELIDEEDPDKLKRIFKRIDSLYFSGYYEFDKTVKLEHFYYGKDDLFDVFKGNAYCYIVPDGLIQDILIHCTRIDEGKESQASFKMRPFIGKFELFDGHVK